MIEWLEEHLHIPDNFIREATGTFCNYIYKSISYEEIIGELVDEDVAGECDEDLDMPLILIRGFVHEWPANVVNALFNLKEE